MARILNISGAAVSDTGIKKLAEYVQANLPDEYTLVIGCKPYQYDIDAILIGKGNIFAIECKDWKGKIKGATYGWWQKDGHIIENPLQQTRNNTVALGKWLREKLQIKGLWVKGLLVFTHDEAHVDIEADKESKTGVTYTSINNMKSLIGYKQMKNSDEDILKTANLFKLFGNRNSLNRVKKMSKWEAFNNFIYTRKGNGLKRRKSHIWQFSSIKSKQKLDEMGRSVVSRLS